jgi:hypothetical protein
MRVEMGMQTNSTQRVWLFTMLLAALIVAGVWIVAETGLLRSSMLTLVAPDRAPLLSFQQVTGLHLLYTMPLAAAVVVFARMVIGVQTFGLFTPMLMAMAFLQTGLIAGPVILFIAIAAGLAIAPALKSLKMARVGFLGGLMAIVAIALLAVVPFFNKIEWVTAFPVVVTALAVERYWTVWEAEGIWDATKVALSTLLVAIGIEAVVLSPPVFWLVDLSPFAAPVVGGVLSLALGLYRGMRLSEMRRFKVVRSA